jgi:hypothetical protein
MIFTSSRLLLRKRAVRFSSHVGQMLKTNELSMLPYASRHFFYCYTFPVEDTPRRADGSTPQYVVTGYTISDDMLHLQFTDHFAQVS